MTVETIAFVPVARVSDVPPGWVLKVKAGHREVALANVDGAYHAVDNACSHAGGPLGDNRLRSGVVVECPWHNSQFNVCTGEPQRGPARKALRTYPVRVEGDQILIAVGEGSPNGRQTDE